MELVKDREVQAHPRPRSEFSGCDSSHLKVAIKQLPSTPKFEDH